MKPTGSMVAIFAALAASASGAQAQRADLRGEQVVKLQCVKCHEAGVNGAPKIGDREAWIPRMKQGVDTLVRSAIRGHGNMPARGGMAQLTDPEFRAAVLYMFSGQDAQAAQAAPAPAARLPYRKTVERVEIDLGVTPSAGSGNYHVNVSLHDSVTRAELKNALVEVRVANALGGQSKALKPVEINGMLAYGNEFRMPGAEAYTITVQVKTKDSAQPIEARFDYKR